MTCKICRIPWGLDKGHPGDQVCSFCYVLFLLDDAGPDFLAPEAVALGNDLADRIHRLLDSVELAAFTGRLDL